MKRSPILVSGCLVGLHCRYDGESIPDQSLLKNLIRNPYFVVCPEQLGGLQTPRNKSQIVGGDGTDVLSGKARVIAEDGLDVTKQFIKGAKETMILVRLYHMEKALFKDKSPSCGVKKIYHEAQLVDGCGVTTALLIQEGVSVEAVS